MTEAALHVIFDWNGTLIDDLDLAVRSVNVCAERFDVERVDKARYRSLFDFPIQYFYAELGFDLDRIPFDDVLSTYLENFDTNVDSCPLHPGVIEGLVELKARRCITVSVLSASYEPTLRRTIAHKGIDRYLDNIVGAPDERAISKLEQARQLASRSSVPTIYVGDTSHDKAVAESCGWEPHLVTCGHQSDERLSQLGVATSDSLLDFLVRLAATDEPEWRTR